ncbi:membrane protein, PF10101 family [Burkholderia multivorans CF2]|nr:membrane protein, PF10101 family [Burkholderia multivorans CF2]
MNWAFAAIGFIVGGIVALIENVSLETGALLGAAAGFYLGHLLKRRGRDDRAAAAPEHFGAHHAQPPASTLAERVARLEATVDTLTRELTSLREQLSGAKASAPLERFEDAAPAGSSTASPSEADDTTPVSPAPTIAATPVTAAAQSTRAQTVAHAPAPAPAPTTESSESAATPSARTAATPTPREPGLAARALQAARDWLFGGNTVVRVGIVVLFFGVAFLLKYAADNDLLPIEFRLAGTALAATVLLALGWRLRARRAAYGLVLQGGGVGLLYLTVFAATKRYELLPVGAAFALMVAICALSAFLAIRQNAMSLATMGSAGGFLAPVLLSTGHGSHVALFGYYALLNAGIFAIAWFKAWRPLNLLGFVFTFTIGSLWGAMSYRPALFASTEPFLVLFFLMYVGIALLYAVRRELALRHYVDGTLVFGTPLVTTALQAALVADVPFALAWSAVALSAFYVAVAAWLAPRRARLGLLFESMLALAVIFATLAVPLAFSGPTTSSAWALEGAALVWLAVREKRIVRFAFGLLMQLAAAGALCVGLLVRDDAAALPVLNSVYVAMLLIALAGVFSGWWLHGRDDARAWHAWMPAIGIAAAAWGLLWWLGGGVHEILAYAARRVDPHRDRFVVDAIVLFAAGTASLAHIVRRRLAWPIAEWPTLALAPALALLAVYAYALYEAPLSGIGALAWPIAVIACYVLLWRESRDTANGDPPPPRRPIASCARRRVRSHRCIR